MDARKVIWHKEAEIDVYDIVNFYIQRNGDSKYSTKLIRKLKNSLNLISVNYQIGQKTDIPNIRSYLIEHYRLFYEVFPETIEILLVWDTRRNPEDLNDLLNR